MDCIFEIRSFEAQRTAVRGEFDHATAFGIFDAIGEHRGAAGACDCACEQIGEVRAEEDVVAEHQRYLAIADEVPRRS